VAEFVLDACVAISWCFPGDPTEDTAYSRFVLQKWVDHDALVPEIWAFEIANSIFVSHNKRQRINEQQIVEYLAPLKRLPIRIETSSKESNLGLEKLARRLNVAAYDAAYLALALRQGLPLATTDQLMRQKALELGSHNPLVNALSRRGQIPRTQQIPITHNCCRRHQHQQREKDQHLSPPAHAAPLMQRNSP